MEAYKHKKDEIHMMLQCSKSNIHISFDLWTSDNSLALLAICGHFVDKNHKIRTVMLALCRVKGSHSGENLTQTVIQVLKEYGINNKLGYFVLDNAESNDTCVEILLQKLHPQLKKQHRRLRCVGHIINLAAQAFLLGDAPPEIFEVKLQIAQHQFEAEQKECDL